MAAPPSPPIHTQRERSNTLGIRARSSSIRVSQAREDEKSGTASAGAPRFSMLAGKGYSWKAARARLPPSRAVWNTVRNPRLLFSIGLVTAIVLLWRSMGSATKEMQRYVR